MRVPMSRTGGGEPRVEGERGIDGRRPSLIRRQLGIVVGAAAGLVVCAVIFAIINLTSGPRVPPPDTMAHTLCADLTSQRYDDLYAQLAPALQSAGTSQQFAASQRQLDTLRGTVSVCSYALVSASDTAATLRFSLMRDHSGPTTADVILRYDSGTWRIESYDAGSF